MSPSTWLRKFLSLTVAHGMLCIGAAAAAATPLIAVGGDPAGSDYGYGISGPLPPDSDGAVGSDRLFAQVQAVYLVYDETGTVAQRSPRRQLRSSAGITPSFLSDPRVRYDPAIGQWLAAEPGSPSAVFLAAANMSDPGQGRRAVSFIRDPDGSVDFSRPDFGWDAIRLSGSDINVPPSHGIGNRNASIAPLNPDLQGATPTVVNATVSSNIIQNQTGMELPPNGAAQLPVAEPVLPAFNAAGVGTLRQISPAHAPVASTTLATAQSAMTMSPGMNTDSAIRQDTTVGNNTGTASFNSGAALHEDRLPRVPAMHPADPAIDDGSASVNPFGGVGLGSSASGSGDYPGGDALAGSTPMLGDPRPLDTGMAPYQPGADNPVAGSGDYSAAALDSGELSSLSTTQGWEAGFDQWSTGISGTAFDPHLAVPEPSSLPVLGIGFAALLLVRRRGVWPVRQAPNV
jgi:hypothetical protein